MKNTTNYFTVAINRSGRRLTVTKELMQQRTHAYCILCKPYIPKVKVKRLKEREGERRKSSHWQKYFY